MIATKEADEKSTKRLLLTTATIPPAPDCEVLGVISGVSVLSRNIVKDMGAALKNTVGGELKTYTSLVEAALNQATERLSDKATSMGADGVFGIQIACPQVTGGAAEVVLIGTAYRIGCEGKKQMPEG